MNDDTLTLYYYNDGLSDEERREVETALRDDAALAARYRVLRRRLETWSDETVTPAPEHAVARWHDSIERAATMSRQRSDSRDRPVHFWSFFWGAAVTAAMAAGIGIGIMLAKDDPAPTIVVTTEPGTTGTPAAFARGLRVHLEDSQDSITTLDSDDPAERMMLILEIIEQNRAFERAASRNNSDDLARVLRAFEPVLVRLAAEDISPEEADALRAQLAFELEVMLTKLARDTSKDTQT